MLSHVFNMSLPPLGLLKSKWVAALTAGMLSSLLLLFLLILLLLLLLLALLPPPPPLL